MGGSKDMEEERIEASIESTAAALQPNFESQRLTKDQINKFKELHRRRLKLKAKSKTNKISKGNASAATKRHGKNGNAEEIKVERSSVKLQDSEDLSSLQQDISGSSIGTKKRQKLHWGLDTKERWERKSNM